ncbi:uncharacterized protein BDV14DRAFT_198969 [Aspergillus stella-maris]|uniref:uncharacterized protein n=1 Tax=Aspergillus stella-maris TaxID=1810926 RepID=UPI003CCDFF11
MQPTPANFHSSSFLPPTHFPMDVHNDFGLTSPHDDAQPLPDKLQSAATAVMQAMSSMDCRRNVRVALVGATTPANDQLTAKSSTNELEFMVYVTDFRGAAKQFPRQNHGDYVKDQLLHRNFAMFRQTHREGLEAVATIEHIASRVLVRFHDLRTIPYLPPSAAIPTGSDSLPCISAADLLLVRLAAAPRRVQEAMWTRDDRHAQALVSKFIHTGRDYIALSKDERDTARDLLPAFLERSSKPRRWWEIKISI